MSSSSIAAAFHGVLAALDKLEIRYAVGGSIASSIYGNYRFTNDADILVDLPLSAVEDFTRELGPAYYADALSLREQFGRGRPWNVIHKATGYKFDLFPVAAQPFLESELRRRTFQVSASFGEPIEFAVTSPEDILLAKLRWYQQTGGASEQQWKDVAGIVAIQGARLDRAYLDTWAKELGVEQLLTRLLT